MASFHDVAERHARQAFLNTSQFAKTWIRRPLGVEADAEEVDAIFEPRPPAFTDAERKKQETEGTLSVAFDQDVDLQDIWESPIGELWATKSLGTPDEGLRDVELIRTVVERTKRSGKRF